MPGSMPMIETDAVRALVDIGFIALSRGLDRHAEAIFDGVTAARPDGEAGPLGMALVALLRSDADRAVKLLRTLPPSDPVRLFLGMALLRRGDRVDAARILTDVAATAADAGTADLARATLAGA